MEKILKCKIIAGTNIKNVHGENTGIFGLLHRSTTPPLVLPDVPNDDYLLDEYRGMAWTSLGWVFSGAFLDEHGKAHDGKVTLAPVGTLIYVVAPIIKLCFRNGTLGAFRSYSLV